MKPWSIQNEIENRVQKESTYEWAVNFKGEQIPPIKKCENIKYSVGWLNLISNAVRDGLIQLKP